jgi:polysaccharide export outer membrane protein
MTQKGAFLGIFIALREWEPGHRAKSGCSGEHLFSGFWDRPGRPGHSRVWPEHEEESFDSAPLQAVESAPLNQQLSVLGIGIGSQTITGLNMSKYSIGIPLVKPRARRFALCAALASLPLALVFLVTGCQTTPKGNSAQAASSFADMSAMPGSTTNSDSIVLQAGDTVRVAFPGAETLNRVVLIRRDGMVTLPQIGEFKAAGLTPKEMEAQLLKQYEPLLQTKEVSVSVESSAFPVYVTGAVLRPGKILSDRPLTALEAIMEAGGFDYTKANLKSVRVLRTHGGHTEHYTLNLKQVLQAQGSEQFPLKPSDIVYVPERFNLF